APSAQQIRIAQAVWHGFALGYRPQWDLWNFVGRETRTANDVVVVERWQETLGKRWPRIKIWHRDLLHAFHNRPVSEGYFKLDERGHRLFIDASVRKLCNRVSALVAMAIEETLPCSVLARFHDWTLCAASKTKHKATLDARIYERLQTAFPNSNFKFSIEG